MDVLFIGGTGIISSACAPLAVERGMRLTLLNRGTSFRPTPRGVETVIADARDAEAVRRAIGRRNFDVVVNWIAFTPDHVRQDIELFRGRTGQYVFISSASAYETPPRSIPVTEETPLSNPFWPYSRDKIACEELLARAFGDEGFPATVVRPSHTYDASLVPLHGGWTNIDRMRRGKPVVVHGDGTSLWVLTHHRDFAVGLVGLLDRFEAIGETYQVTSDEVLTWNRIAQLLAEAAGCEAEIVHVPSDTIAAWDRYWGESLLGDKTHCMTFDNSKVRRAVPEFDPRIPFADGAREIVEWHDADPARRQVDPAFDALLDRIVAAQRSARPTA
jgi:nucleoside-diphosphate-sugar epimerase